MKANIKLVTLYLKRYGLKRTLGKALSKLSIMLGVKGYDGRISRGRYTRYIKMFEPSAAELERQRSESMNGESRPRISLVVPVFNPVKVQLEALVASVISQTYSNWELCLSVSDCDPEIKEYLDAYINKESRIVAKYSSQRLGISENTNRAIDFSTGEYFGFLDQDDTLAPDCLFEVAKVISLNSNAELIYTDEDKISEDGSKRFAPHFKPAWNPDLLRSYNYITHFVTVKRSFLEKVGGLSTRFDGCQDYDLLLRISEKTKNIFHIPKVLYHWRQHGQSTSLDTGAKFGIAKTTLEVVEAHLNRVGRIAEISDGPFVGSVSLKYKLKAQPKVSIVIPSRDHATDLRRCLDSIKNKTSYDNYEILVVENGSKEKDVLDLYEEYKIWDRFKLLTWDKPFNYSAINNFAVSGCDGEYLLFLNNDTSVISPDWLERMIGHAQFQENGAVGAKLYYPNDTVQHAGVVIGRGETAGHLGKFAPRSAYGYFGRLNLIQDFSAVTAACVMISRKAFEMVGGFDESFPVSFNDIDLCLRLGEMGLLTVFDPMVELYHFESQTRGLEDTEEKRKRLEEEEGHFIARWEELLFKGDPYYPQMLDLSMDLDTSQFKRGED